MAGPRAFSPSVYEHAAALIGKTPLQVSQSSDLLFRAHTRAYGLYQHSPVVIGIDIYNLEAEAYGATISTPEGIGIPAIRTHPVAETSHICKLKPFNPKKDGRIPMVIEAGRRLQRKFPEADVRIPVSGPFSLASNLVGFNRLLSDILENPGSVLEALSWLAGGQIGFSSEVISQGLGIAFFESGATPPLISPDLFTQIELPVLKFMIDKVSALTGYQSPCIIGGNTAPVIRSMMSTGTGYVICPGETDQELFMKEMEAWPETMVRINMTPEVLVSDDLQKVFHELERVINLAGRRDKACIGTGVLPFETNPDIVLSVKEYLQRRNW